MIIKIKENLKNEIFKSLNNSDIKEEDIVIEKPKDRSMGDLAIPCFHYSKALRKSPNQIAEEIKENLNSDKYEKIEVVGAYLNVFLDKKEITKEVLNKVFEEKQEFASSNIGKDKTIVMDYSAPNIAKPFGIGHLRSTVIGNSIKRIHKKLGYNVIGVNHLGDWGTQFGKMIYAYKTWGDKEVVKKNLIPELKKLYVKFHEEADKDDSLNEKAREWFKKLENGDKEAISLWQWFRDESLEEFMKTYRLLDITDFESYNGEAFYNDKMESVVKELEEKNLLIEDDGAKIVDLGDNIAPALIKKSDGSSLYATRDLAAIFYRKKEYNFDECLYVVGNEQTLHFAQLKEVLKKMGYNWQEDIKHISFGMMLENGKKMSTRKGTSGELSYLLNESINMVKKYIEEKNPNLENKDEVSKIVGVGAVIFNDLKTYRKNDVDFNLENVLKFEGETGPYIGYTNSRIKSLLNGIEINKVNTINIDINKYIWNIVLDLLEFEETIIRAKKEYDPSEIAKYVLSLAKDFNSLYGNEKIITDNEEEKNIKALISECTSIILKEGMSLLGINIPDQM